MTINCDNYSKYNLSSLDEPIQLLDDGETSDSSLDVGTCQNGGFPLSNGGCNCPAYVGAPLCNAWQCLNGGYKNITVQGACVCPAGYLGTHCEPGIF